MMMMRNRAYVVLAVMTKVNSWSVPGATENANPLSQQSRTSKCSEKEHEACVVDIVNASSLGNGEFLIDIAWTDETAKHHHRLCPEMLGFDAQERTNAEKRGLCRGCSISTDGCNLSNFMSFIPSEQA